MAWIDVRTAHRRLARPAHPSCPHPGDQRPKLSARHQLEGTAAIGPGAKPKPENAKRRRPRHRNIIRHESTKINRASQPFSLNPTGTLSRRPLAHFVSAIDSSMGAIRQISLVDQSDLPIECSVTHN